MKSYRPISSKLSASGRYDFTVSDINQLITLRYQGATEAKSVLSPLSTVNRSVLPW